MRRYKCNKWQKKVIYLPCKKRNTKKNKKKSTKKMSEKNWTILEPIENIFQCGTCNGHFKVRTDVRVHMEAELINKCEVK